LIGGRYNIDEIVLKIERRIELGRAGKTKEQSKTILSPFPGND
jgi:hypothetical protein